MSNLLTSIALTAKEGLDLAINTASEMVNNLVSIPSKEYVNNLVNNLGTLKVTDVVADLSALNAKYPNGITGVVITIDDGFWNYWNGTTWTKGTLFNTLGIADGSVTYSKQNFMEVQGGEYEIYDEVVVNGGIDLSGLDVVDETGDYGRTNYLELNSGNFISDILITLTDTQQILTTPYVFLYTDKGIEGTKKTFTSLGNGVFTANISLNYKYLRMVLKSPAIGDISNSLDIKVKVNSSKVLINKYDLDERFLKSENYLLPKSVTTENIDDGSVTYEKQDFVNVTDGIFEGELYDNTAVSGGFTTTGLDAVSSLYLRTNYLALPDHECTITITDTSGVLTTPYLFLYTEQGVAGTRITAFTNPSTGVYVFEFTDINFNYMRMLTKSPTWGDCSTTLSIMYKYIENDEVIINSYDLDTRYKKADYLGSPSEIVHFTNKINVNFADIDSDTLNAQDTVTELEDNAILFLPPNYSKTGKPVRLVIGCHGMSSTPIGSTTTSLAGAQSFLNSMGYAVLDVNGIPLSMSGNTNYNFGSPLALQSYLKAYKHVIDNYNVTKDVFVYGISMGGLTSNALVNSGSIPVVAQGNFCPVLDLFKQMYYPSVAQRELFAELHDFDGRESITFTTSQNATQDEIDLYMANLDKLYGLSPMSAKCINWDNTYLNNINDVTEQTNYNSLIRFHNVPLKVWHNQDDTTVAPRYSDYYVNAIQKGGSIAQIRHFPTGGHNAWSNGATINVTDIEGNTVSPHASEYELYLWFKRFE